MTRCEGRMGFGDAPTSAIVLRTPRGSRPACGPCAQGYPLTYGRPSPRACVQLTPGPRRRTNSRRPRALVARAAATGADARRAAREMERDRRRRMLRAGAEPLEGGESVAAMSGWAREHGITLVGGSITESREGREKLRTPASSSTPRRARRPSTARSTSSTSRSAGTSTASRRPRSRATSPSSARPKAGESG